ncbi:MAG TPA: hypothetical protein VF610_02890 [Segetibacter sp.]|jgi:hypothetical protein
MIKAYKIYTGSDNHSHVQMGAVVEEALSSTISIRFKETPAYSAYDWHPAPTKQYVLSLSGTLEFETRTGERFTLHPGEVLIALDTTGSGHKWQLIDDEPWRRAYIALGSEDDINFVEI